MTVKEWQEKIFGIADLKFYVLFVLDSYMLQCQGWIEDDRKLLQTKILMENWVICLCKPIFNHSIIINSKSSAIPKYFYNFIFVQFVTFPLFNKLLLYQFSLFKCISSVNFSFLLKTTKKEKRSFIYGLWAIYVPMGSTTSFLLNIIISLIVFEPYTTVSQLHYLLLTITNVTPDYQ